LRFDEQMEGFFSELVGPDGDFESGEALGRAGAQRITTRLTITHDDLSELLSDPSLPASISGRIDLPSLGVGPLTVTSGQFVLLTPDPTHVETDRMTYSLAARSDAGVEYLIEGFKVIRHGPAVRAWRDTTTLFTTIDRVDADGMPTPVGKGILRVTVAGLARLVASMQILNVEPRSEQERLRLCFLRMFLGSLWPFYSGSLDERRRFPVPPAAPVDLPEPGGLPAEVVRWCDPSGTWHDHLIPGACSRLIRYRGGNKGPLMLASGYAMSATSFGWRTDRPSLLELLVEDGFDVWLFDYRAGIELPSAWSQCTIDDIATLDWPRAVAEVRRISGSEDVQAFGHCVGSVSLLMTLLNGTEGIRSAMCAQFTLHPVTSTLNKAKAAFHVGSAMAELGIARVVPDVAFTLPDVGLDLALRPIPMPRSERCGLAVCRWINAIFGCTHLHAQLNQATHDQIPDMFGVGNLTGLRHLGLMLQGEIAVDAYGLDRYLPHVDRLDLPIHFVAGIRNDIFHPQGTERTLNWLGQHFGSQKARQNYSVTYLEHYGHLDALIGRDAAVEVFPQLLERLNQHAAR